MFNFSELKQIHLEISSNCQASCPMCTRNIHGGLPNELLPINNWTLEQYQKIIDDIVLNQVSMLYFCGNYGDPIMNNQLLEMVSYTTSVNPKVEIRIHTNGSLRNKTWWSNLAKAMPKNHCVIFAIDGLSDTHSIYRIGTDFNKIIENATAFIEAGGNAEWTYLRFKHNEHQVEAAKKMAADLKFQTFVMKDSSRFLLDAKFPVLSKTGEVEYHLEPSTYSEIKFIDKRVIDNYKQIVQQTTIDCRALQNKEIYIDAQMNVFPCCWLATTPYQPMDREQLILPVRTEILEQYHILVESLGGLDSLNAYKNQVKDIIQSEPYQTVWHDYWNTNKLITCTRSCGILPEVFSRPADQIRSVDNLNE